MWIIGGFIEIERLGERIGQFMRLPFQAVWNGVGQPTLEWIEQQAQDAAREFLSMLRDTVPGHADDYGGFGNVNVTFATFHF